MADQQQPAELADYPIVIVLPVQWGDQDAFAHVNNTVPFRWFESARIAYLERSGVSHLLTQPGLGPILASITCHYRRQIKYPDTVRIGARVSAIGRSSMVMEHAVYSEQQQAIAADGESVVVVFDYAANKPRRVPDEVRQAIADLEVRDFSQ